MTTKTWRTDRSKCSIRPLEAERPSSIKSCKELNSCHRDSISAVLHTKCWGLELASSWRAHIKLSLDNTRLTSAWSWAVSLVDHVKATWVWETYELTTSKSLTLFLKSAEQVAASRLSNWRCSRDCYIRSWTSLKLPSRAECGGTGG